MKNLFTISIQTMSSFSDFVNENICSLPASECTLCFKQPIIIVVALSFGLN